MALPIGTLFTLAGLLVLAMGMPTCHCWSGRC